MSDDSGRLSNPVHEADHVRGPATAPVTIVEYGDYQCPFCKAAEPIVDELVQALGDSLRVVFRHLPLSRYHPDAEEAAEAAEAAGAQGKFWEMHTTLFAHQDALDEVSLRGYAGGLELDVARFDQEVIGHTFRARVRADLLSALESGARGTPTFFIDGLRHDGPVDLIEMLSIVGKNHPELDSAIRSVTADMRVPGMTVHAQETSA